MATQTKRPPSSARARSSGWLTLASCYLALAGAFNVIWGLTAWSKKSYFVEDGLVWSSLESWGGVAVLIGVAQIVIAYLIHARKVAGMLFGIVAAMSGALVNFMSIGAYPIWSGAAMVCSLLVLWAVTVHWEEP